MKLRNKVILCDKVMHVLFNNIMPLIPASSYTKLREIAVGNLVNWEHIYQKYTHNWSSNDEKHTNQFPTS